MENKFLATLKQGTVKPDGTQVIAVYGTISKTGHELLIGNKFRIADSDVYSIVEYEGMINEKLIWVL